MNEMTDKTDNTIEELNEEIIQGIYNLSDGDTVNLLNDINTNNTLIQTTITTTMSPTTNQKCVLLFRKYANIANEIKDSVQIKAINNNNDNNNSNHTNGTIVDLNSIIPESDYEKLIGMKEASGTFLFWIRLTDSLLSFIVCIIMASVRYIKHSIFIPSNYFSVSYVICMYSISEIIVNNLYIA